jgi:hypothetical protein
VSSVYHLIILCFCFVVPIRDPCSCCAHAPLVVLCITYDKFASMLCLYGRDRYQKPEQPKFPFYMREWNTSWYNIDTV